MWFGRVELQRSYTFVIIVLLALIAGIVSILIMPSDILPEVGLPLISVICTYDGLGIVKMSKRLVERRERALPMKTDRVPGVQFLSSSSDGKIQIPSGSGTQVELAPAQIALFPTRFRVQCRDIFLEGPGARRLRKPVVEPIFAARVWREKFSTT